jgi:hypothetical protein
MKKQILILIMALIAISFSTAYGQAIHHTAPQPLSCTTGPLNPVAGVPYDYSATLAPAGGNAYWYATTSTTFISGSARTAVEQAVGGTFVAAATNYQDAATVAASPTTTNITWNAAGLSTINASAPLFLVVDYTADPAINCANNMKVYQILPQNGFIVDVYNLDQSKANPVFNTNVPTCVSNIAGASYSGGAIVTDYGTNYLYYEIVAANFNSAWTPSFAVTGLQGSQTSVIEWSYDNTFATIEAGDVSTALTNTSAGVSIFVRVTIHNNTYEGLSDTPITLTVNGVSDGLADVTNTDCTLTSLTDDQAIQTLKARPTVTGTTGTGFVTP